MRQKEKASLMPDPSFQPQSALEAAQAAQASAENIADSLKVSEVRYRRLFEAARDGILILDIDLGRITDANPFMSELLGYSHDELLGKELWEIGLLKDKEAGQETFRRLRRDGYIRFEDLPLENRNGEKREVEFVCNIYRENGHMVIQCNIRDVTERKRIEAALATAAAKNERIVETLQRSMLQTPILDKFTGIDVETLYQAALNEAEVGGDFFDVFALSGDRIALVVGDVSGKGLAAAGRTAEVKYALRAFLHQQSHAAEVAMPLLNEFIYETHRLDKNNFESFITLTLAVIHPATGEVIFSSAGSEPSVVLRKESKPELVKAAGYPLGIEQGAIYTGKSIFLESGDTLLMATDGITEARHGNVFLGIEGLVELIEKAGSNLPLPELSKFIYDVCLLLARRK
jgi:PAS domain S-box-containing protein